jgi:hypothetical protein
MPAFGSTCDVDGPAAAMSVHRQSWDWLHGLARRLGVVVDLLDNRGEPRLAYAGEADRGAMRRLLSSNEEPIRSAVAAALAGKTEQPVSVLGQVIAFAPIAVTPRCALAVGRRTVPGNPGESPPLHDVASWLAAAVEAQLRNPGTDEKEAFERITALQRVFRHAAASGRERDVVRGFAEALAIWDDVEVRGYVERVGGLFALDVMLPGSIQSNAPLVLHDRAGFMDAPLVRVQEGEAERLGFAAGMNLLISRVDTSWVLALSGAIPVADEPRLSVYMSLLGQAIRSAAHVAMSRTTWPIIETLIVSAGQFEATATRVVDELKAVFGATAAMLQVATASGTHLRTVGDREMFTSTEPQDQLTVALPVADRHRVTVGIARPNGPAFQRSELRLLNAVARLLATWLPGVTKAMVAESDRGPQKG